MDEYMPGHKACARAALVICNGGSATVYQALAAGVPVLGLPGNLDQFLMMHFVRSFGAGEFVRAGEASVDAVAAVAGRLLCQERYRVRARALKGAIARAHGVTAFPAVVEGLFSAAAGLRHPDTTYAGWDSVYSEAAGGGAAR